MSSIGARIRQSRERAGMTQLELAKSLKVTNVTVSNWESDTHNLRAGNAVKLANTLGVSVNYLMYGTKPKPEIEIDSALEDWDDDTPLAPDEVEIPFFKENELAAGLGELAAVEHTARKLRFSRRTLKAYGVSPETAVAATVVGNSMEPNIADGASIGIDTGNTVIQNGKIYAFRHGEMLRITILYRTPHGGLRISSYNKEEYPDEIVTADELPNIHIIGRIFWYSVMLK